jgi:hypothetical protein
MTFKRQHPIGDVRKGTLWTCDVMSEDAALSGEECCAPLTRRPVTFPLTFQRHNEPRPRLRAVAFRLSFLFICSWNSQKFVAVGAQSFRNHE